jgi:uncharacterized protein
VVSRSYVDRLIDPLLDELIGDVPGVMIVGPRACGKTTTSVRRAKTVLRMDRDDTKNAVGADPDAVLGDSEPLVLVDEWQRAPVALAGAKRLIDLDPAPGRFLFTGSASDTLSPDAWPGTGRFIRVPMWGLTQRELLGLGRVRRSTFFDAIADAEGETTLAIGLPSDIPDIAGYVDLLLASGFPEAFARSSTRTRSLWLESYVNHIVGRDVDLVGEVRVASRLHRYLAVLATNTAGIPALQTLATSASINRDTAQRFDGFLERLFITEQVPAWASNRLSRLAATPKRYLCEPALAAPLIGLERRSIIRNADISGRMIDSFVAAQIRPELQLGSMPVSMFHMRQDGRREIDLVLERRDGALVAIEIKAATDADLRDARHLVWLRDQLGLDRFRAGIVFYTGRHIRRLDSRIWAIPICALWGV